MSKGGVITEVMTATATITVYIAGVSTPRLSPNRARMISIPPRAFIPKATAKASRNSSPPSFPPKSAPAILAVHATPSTINGT